ncbi:hypothetical protein NQZ79_g2983 [Umbelopsis isabellina]|nr:hypothetical protein NQZ79_g2983 [Umbelopsis isabellina]
MGGKIPYQRPISDAYVPAHISQLPTCEFTPFRGLDDKLFNCLREVIYWLVIIMPILFVKKSIPIFIPDIPSWTVDLMNFISFLFRPENFVLSEKVYLLVRATLLQPLSYRSSLAPRQFYSSKPIYEFGLCNFNPMISARQWH